MNSIPCNIVLLPDAELTQKALVASKLLATHDSLFTLKLGAFYPHLSLYMFQLNTEDIPKVEAVLETIAHSFHATRATATAHRMGEGHGVGYIDPEYEPTAALHALQDAVVAAANPLRAGMREKDKAKLQDASGLARENLQKYGYPNIGELFRPHITLTRLKKYKPEVLRELPPIHTFDGTFVGIGLYEMGDNGTCIREIKRFALLP